MRHVIALLTTIGFALPAYAQQGEVDAAIRDADVAAAAVAEATPPREPFESYLQRQASLEVQIGLRLYEEFDDYRAITAFRRYQFLSKSPRADFVASLMIGQIYHRNDKPELSTIAFENAARAAEHPYEQTFSYLLGLQQICLPLSYYVQCRQRLAALADTELEPAVRQLVDYQLMYADVVLRSDNVTPERAASFEEPRLREKAVSLVEANAAFDELPLKRPWLAGTLSALLPGAGQLYNGRPVDALLALTVNGALGAATYLSFARAKSIPLGVVVAIITAGFYSGNIVNAVVDAKKINAERYRTFFERLKVEHWPRVAFTIDENEVLFSYGFDWPGPTLKNRASTSLEGTDQSQQARTVWTPN